MTKHGHQSSAARPRIQAPPGARAQGKGAFRRPERDETPSTGDTCAQDDEPFDEVPTVANRPLPRPANDSEAAPAERPPGIGAYRLIRPAASGAIDLPVAKRAKGVVIGVSRK